MKSALLAGAGFAILAGTAIAQDPAPAAEPAATEADTAAAGSGSEEVTVTGSRIRKNDYTANSPLQTVTGDTLREIGVATVETYLNTLPQFSPALSKSNNNPQGGGTATLDLRQLGSARGLVLMNGRRLLPGFSGGSVDVSILPPALLERVEIITGGASAVYGSDAISGVVNFILRDDFSGIEATAKYGVSEFGDGVEVNLSATMGGNFEDDKGNAVLSIGYTQRDRLGQGARGFSANAVTCAQPQGADPVGTFISGLYCYRAGSPTTPDGTVLAIATSATPTAAQITPAQAAALQAQLDAYFALPANGGAAPGTVVLSNPNAPGGWIGFNPDGTVFGTGGALGNTVGQNVVNYRGPFQGGYDPTSYSYNFNPDNELLLGLERYNIYTKVQYDITDSISAWADVLFTQYTSATALAPAPTTISGVPVSILPLDLRNMFIAAGIPTTNTVNVARRFNELGPRAGNFDTTSWQLSGGFEGTFEGPAEGTSWAWDLTASYGKYRQEVYFRGYASISRALAAARGCPAGSPTAINGQACVAANIFGAGSISGAARRYIEYPYFDNTYIEQTNIIGNVTGDVFELPYGWVSLAVGLEYRQQQFARVADESLPSGDVGGANTAAPFSGSFDVYEAYGEVIVPIVNGLDWVHDLSLEAGFRYSDYNTGAGTTETYKYGLSYSPVEWLRFRALKQAAVRAPSLGELYAARNEGFPGITSGNLDPCSTTSPNNTPAVQALCAAQAPAVNFATFVSPSSGQYRTFSGGNPNLQPEEADTLTLGAVFQSPSDWSPWFGGLSITLDYWKVEISNVVSAVGFATSLSRCYNTTYNPTLSASNPYCLAVNRDQATGLLNSTSTGFITQTNANLSQLDVAGWDLGLVWRADLEDLGAGEDMGTLGLSIQATKMDSYEFTPLPGDATTDYVGTIDDGTPSSGPIPEYKATTTLSYAIDDFAISWRWVYIDGVEGSSGLIATPNGVRQNVFEIPSYSYHYINASYALTENVEIFGGVDNVFDKQPPYYNAGFQFGTDPGTYDVIGRYYYLGVTTRF